jgi:hypothetical protein
MGATPVVAKTNSKPGRCDDSALGVGVKTTAPGVRLPVAEETFIMPFWRPESLLVTLPDTQFPPVKLRTGAGLVFSAERLMFA